VDDEVHWLDLSTWEIANVTDTPEEAVEVSRCAVTEVNGREGILTRSGFFFDPQDLSWTQFVSIPTPDSTNVPNEMWSFRGSPTVFGAPRCDGANGCTNDQVIQLSMDSNEWSIIGRMNRPRRFHEMVELPRAFCDLITPEEVIPEPVQNVPGPTAAIIVGGYTGGFSFDSLADVEIFGCDQPKAIAQPPFKAFLTGGTYVEEQDGDRYVIVCGGNVCESEPCVVSDRCLEYRPADNAWTEVAPMVKRRYNHIMEQVCLQ
jgi:hypothetical protein